MNQFLLLRIEFPSDREEAMLAALYSSPAGECLGIEQDSWFEPEAADAEAFVPDLGESSLVAYFDPSTQFTSDQVDALRTLGATRVEQELQGVQDWQAKYRQQAQPIFVGEGFVFDPREPLSGGNGAPPDQERGQERAGRRWLQLPARQAFGTGSHETTQLMVEAMEQLDLDSRSVLDVGVGSGVLSLVAKVRGASRVQACDIDLVAAVAARDNSELNQLEAPALFVGKVDALSRRSDFDCVLVNVLEDRISSSVAVLQELVGPGGNLLVSGCLALNRERVEGLWQTPELRVVGSRQKAEWLLLHLRRQLSIEENRGHSEVPEGRSCQP